jgi:hypothetical protein
MVYIGLILMISGLVVGLVSIFRASRRTISPVCLGCAYYIGLFIALIGAIMVGKV